MKFKALLCTLLCAALALTAFASCGSQGAPEPETQAKSYYDLFDTVSVIISYKGDSPQEFAANCKAVHDTLSEYHKLFDIYYEYTGINNIKTINKNAGIKPVQVDEKLIDFLLYCKEMYTLTSGKTNIAMGSVLKLWHKERDLASTYPDEARIPDFALLEAASKHTDINTIRMPRPSI